MTAFLGISVWVTLATVVPGLMTIAALYGGFWATAPESVSAGASLGGSLSPAAAISIMVLTQTLGIVVEEVLIHRRWYGPQELEVDIPPGIDPHGTEHFTLHPYAEYKGLYLLLAELRQDEDTQGHLQRCVAQFFLTNNSLVSFVAGMICTVALLASRDGTSIVGGLFYLAALMACLAISVLVVRIRFRVMAQALWAARRRRLAVEAETRSSQALDIDREAQQLRGTLPNVTQIAAGRPHGRGPRSRLTRTHW